MCHIMSMPSVNIRELRDSKQLKEWLREGKIVELRERNKRIARIIPERQAQGEPVEWPDFAARAKKIFGNRHIPVVNDLIRDRGRF